MPACEYCQKNQARIKYCSRKCSRKGYRIIANAKRATKCALCRTYPRVIGATRCKTCGPLPKVISCRDCGRTIKRSAPGKRFCTSCKQRRKNFNSRNRDRADQKFVISCPRCNKFLSGYTLMSHAVKCNLPLEEIRAWYTARKESKKILKMHEWTLGDKTIDQLDGEYFAWRSS